MAPQGSTAQSNIIATLAALQLGTQNPGIIGYGSRPVHPRSVGAVAVPSGMNPFAPGAQHVLYHDGMESDAQRYGMVSNMSHGWYAPYMGIPSQVVPNHQRGMESRPQQGQPIIPEGGYNYQPMHMYHMNQDSGRWMTSSVRNPGTTTRQEQGGGSSSSERGGRRGGRSGTRRSSERKEILIPLDIDRNEYKDEFNAAYSQCCLLDERKRKVLLQERTSGHPSPEQLVTIRNMFPTDAFDAVFVSRVPPIYFLECSLEYEGSKALQKVLEDRHDDLALMYALRTVLLPYITELTSDVFGNYVVQKLLEHGDDQIKQQVGSVIVQKALQLSLHFYGCRVVQCAMKHLSQKDCEAMCGSLCPFTLHMVGSQNANHVVQAWMRLDEDKRPKSVVQMHEMICHNPTVLARHEYGCRVLQAAIESNLNPDLSKRAIEQLMHEVADLSGHENANFVIQFLVQTDAYKYRDQIVKQLCLSDIYNLSCHKFASNVVEKALIHGTSNQRDDVIQAILESCQKMTDRIDLALTNFAADKYGNYVMQSALDVAAPMEKQLLVSYLRQNLSILLSSAYGKHLASILT